ncbi:SRPBCC family protein [Bordetella petrii]|uniref:SRPBCC family protein n=1 Tax=Bordetella petrii TaxID=94624 RepID=UPI001E2D748B|nr:SRPBCC family protein [Bordetella petrii]MCD0503867.1 SRPBCC family protein [Bordetella petrii]
MATGTVKFHRVLRAPAERIYRAFLEPDAIARWLPPYGYTCLVHELDARVGGKHRMSFRNFGANSSHDFGGEYLELVPSEKIRYSDQFDDPNLPGQMQTTISLHAVSCGTEINIVQEGIPEAIPAEMCYLGWQESLEQLARLVEPEIPG